MAPPAPAPRQAYLAGFDALRAIAAISVCLFHFTNGALPKVVVPAVQRFFLHGDLGVVIFFVISGFIIPYSLVGKNHGVSRLLPYLKKRIIRIAPTAYVAMLLVLAQWVIIDRLINHNNNYTQSISFQQLIHNLLFTIPYTSYKWIIGVSWTLSVELQFYLFIGVLFSLLFERRHIGWFIGAYVAAFVVHLVVPMPSSNFFRFSPVFALGGITLLWQQKKLSPIAYAGCLVFFSTLAYWQIDGYVASVGIATALVINIMTVKVPVLGYLGKMSYSIYLLHVLIGTSAEFVLVKFISPDTVGSKLFITVLCLIAAIAGSYVFYRLVEQPIMRWASRQR